MNNFYVFMVVLIGGYFLGDASGFNKHYIRCREKAKREAENEQNVI